MRRWIALAGLGLVACATSTAEYRASAEPYWLFKAETLDDLPPPEGGQRFAAGRYQLIVPAAFVPGRPVTEGSRSELRLEHRSSKTEVRSSVEDHALPLGNGARIKSMLAFMNEGFAEISERRQLRVELLSTLGAASAARMDGLPVDGLCWWRPGGYRFCLKVVGKHEEDPESLAVLLADLRQLLAQLDAANGGE